MQKQEFEERIERTVTDEQYKVIEEVYMWHPSIRNTSGKDEVAELYKSFGMTIFHDMLALHFRILTIMLIYNLVNHALLNYILLYAIYKNRPRILIRCAVCSIR